MARNIMVASQMQFAEGRTARNPMIASQMELAEGRLARNIMVASQMQLVGPKWVSNPMVVCQMQLVLVSNPKFPFYSSNTNLFVYILYLDLKRPYLISKLTKMTFKLT